MSTVIFSGLPTVDISQIPYLSRFVLLKAGEALARDLSKVYIPLDSNANSLGVAIVRYRTNDEAQQIINNLHGTAIDRNHGWNAERAETSQIFADLHARGDIDESRIDGLGFVTNVVSEERIPEIGGPGS